MSINIEETSTLRVLLTRSAEENNEIARLLRARGVESLSLPMIEVRDLSPDLKNLPPKEEECVILLTSKSATERWLNLRMSLPKAGDIRVRTHLVVGRTSASLLLDRHPSARILCLANSIEELLEDVLELHEKSHGIAKYQKRIPLLYPCSRLRREVAIDGFNELGYRVYDLPLYEPRLPAASIEKLPRALEALAPDATLTFFSPSAVENFCTALQRNGMGIERVTGFRFAAIGTTTEEALNSKGIEDVMVPRRPGVMEMVGEIAGDS